MTPKDESFAAHAADAITAARNVSVEMYRALLEATTLLAAPQRPRPNKDITKGV